jgi:UDP-glucose 4-epimerase
MNRNGVLLLGGTGFIGGALAKRLRLEEMPVHVIGRENKTELATLLPQCGTVIHLASSTTSGSSARHAHLEADNITLTLHLLERMLSLPPAHLIFFSSAGTVYVNPVLFPVAEESVIAPLSNHGAGKAAQEIFCKTLTSYGHAVTVLRPSNAYGLGQHLRPGFGLIRTLLEHVRQGTSLEIWGDGENVRDYIYIDDIVEATLRLIRLPQDCCTYNLGSGVGYSINKVKELVKKVCGHNLATAYRPARGMDVRSVVLDISRLTTKLDWQPDVGLLEGVTRTQEWLQNP